MTLLTELCNEIDNLYEENKPPSIMVLGLDKYKELHSQFSQHAKFELDENDPRYGLHVPTLQGVPIIIDHIRKDVVEYYQEIV